ncbi:MAG TPA: aminoacyl-tRNA hydrolase [Candidatus Paceibacterota bacterium]|nr:aminoacyl-tRNA hydrolase [Candidatus Paceibacterota bacterium]
MSFLFVGLGNPGDKYARTRHNAGRLALEYLQKKFEQDFSPWKKAKKPKAIFSDGVFADQDVTLLLPDNFMNLSGESVKKLVREEADAARVVVVHDEIDLPLSKMQIAFGKGSGGHNGVQSIIDQIGTKDFIRIRVGVSPMNWFGNIKKPQGKEAVTRFLLSDFKKKEQEKLEEIFLDVTSALEMIVREGKEKTMNHWNEH